METVLSMASINLVGHDFLIEMFKFFGVLDLDPTGGDVETILNTWFVLSAKVGEDIRARNLFPDTVYAADSKKWAPEYRKYIEALWRGDVAQIAVLAKALGIKKGVPKEVWDVRNGPIQHQRSVADFVSRRSSSRRQT